MPLDPDEPSIDQTIEALVGDLSPVRPLRVRGGMATGLVLTAAAAGAVWLSLGFRADIMALQPPPLIVARGAILLLGGSILLLAALRAAVPGRADHGATLAGTAVLGLLPIGLMGLLLDAIAAGERPSFAELAPFPAARCLAVALATSLVIGLGLVLWLRRAAPTDPVRASWLTGWAAAGLGTFAYSLFCPSESLAFATAVYPAAMLLAACVIRLAAAPMLRW